MMESNRSRWSFKKFRIESHFKKKTENTFFCFLNKDENTQLTIGSWEAIPYLMVLMNLTDS